MHIVILGNGIIALTVAFRLSRRLSAGDKITIVGDSFRVGSATLAAGAMLNSFAEIEYDSLENELDLYRFELSHLAGRMWPKFESDLIDAAGDALPLGCRKCMGYCGGGCYQVGTYVINNTAADNLDDRNFDAIQSALEDFNEPYKIVSPEEIPNYKPDQKYRATRALLIENEGWFNPRLIVEKLDAILHKHPQVCFINAYAKSLCMQAGEIVNVRLDNGESLAGDKFILATGASVSRLLQTSNLGIEVQKIFYGVGVSIQINTYDGHHTNCIRTPNRGLACGIYSVPYFVGPNIPNNILLGATNFISPVPIFNPRISSVESILKAGMEQINSDFYRGEIIQTNVGWRPAPQDSYPLIGQTSISNLIIASGTKRDGFHMSPVISDYITKLVHGEPFDKRWLQFSPERKLIKNITRQQAINKGVEAQVSAAYQHGFSPAKSRMVDQLKKMYKDDLERLHDQVGAIDWGIPSDMLDMYRYGHAQF
jgi:glycine/D-amino acid oxidase-like deaminating enzyme